MGDTLTPLLRFYPANAFVEHNDVSRNEVCNIGADSYFGYLTCQGRQQAKQHVD